MLVFMCPHTSSYITDCKPRLLFAKLFEREMGESVLESLTARDHLAYHQQCFVVHIAELIFQVQAEPVHGYWYLFSAVDEQWVIVKYNKICNILNRQLFMSFRTPGGRIDERVCGKRCKYFSQITTMKPLSLRLFDSLQDEAAQCGAARREMAFDWDCY